MLMARTEAGVGSSFGDACVTTPSAPGCTTYTYPDERAFADLDNLCAAMPFMVACSLYNACNATSASQAQVSSRWRTVCDPFVLLATICGPDNMGGMGGCASYNSMCGVGGNGTANGTAPAQCTSARAGVSGLPTSAATNADVRSICSEMDMDGCSECTPSWRAGKKWGACDLLGVYGRLCHAMPDMSQCGGWSAMCAVDASLYPCRGMQTPTAGGGGGSDDSGGGDFSGGPVMKMYFFNEMPFYLLFRSWTPSTPGQLAGAWIAIFALGLVYEALQALQAWLTLRSLKLTVVRGGGTGGGGASSGKSGDALRGTELADCPCSSTQPSELVVRSAPLAALHAAFSPPRLSVDLGRAALKFVTVGLSYLLMLAAMSFNVAIFFAVICGLSIGWFLFARLNDNLASITADDGCHSV